MIQKIFFVLLHLIIVNIYICTCILYIHKIRICIYTHTHIFLFIYIGIFIIYIITDKCNIYFYMEPMCISTSSLSSYLCMHVDITTASHHNPFLYIYSIADYTPTQFLHGTVIFLNFLLKYD